MNKEKKKRIPVEFLVAVVLVILIVGGVFFAYRWDAKKREALSGTYSNTYQINGSQDNEITVYYKFDAKTGRYEELWGERQLMTGEYTAEGDKITIVTDGNEDIGAESETEVFLVKDGLLIPEGYIYEGQIPEGDTFTAECTMTDSAGQEYVVSFAEDGHYTYTVKGSGGADDESMSGTYEREGDHIHRTNGDGAQMTDFYIYEGRLAGIFYTKE